VPIYEYRCEKCGASFEVMQRMSDEPLSECEKCGGALRKVLHPVAIHFKGSGFYTTDYGKGSGRRAGSKETGSGDSESSSSDSSPSSSSSESSSGDGSSAGSGGKPASGEGKSKEKQKAT
jgi:putative FmdB family regulatory protein